MTWYLHTCILWNDTAGEFLLLLEKCCNPSRTHCPTYEDQSSSCGFPDSSSAPSVVSLAATGPDHAGHHPFRLAECSCSKAHRRLSPASSVLPAHVFLEPCVHASPCRGICLTSIDRIIFLLCVSLRISLSNSYYCIHYKLQWLYILMFIIL